MLNSRIILIAYLLLFTFKVNGQQNSGIFGRVNIASPNAASLGKYGDIPVNNHTGIPNISIPLYTLKEGSLSIPISLSYHASGIRVEENASWVGAGWSLNAGGVITRTVKDKPDERRTQSLQQEYGHLSNNGFANYVLLNPGSKAITHDFEPDLFSFNFNGYSGKFYFDDSRNPIVYPEQDFKIEYVYRDELWSNSPGYSVPGGIGKSIESFVITTPDGDRYFFGIPDEPIASSFTVPIEVTSSYTSSSGMINGKVISSWYLYKIISADGNSIIKLYYKSDKYAFFTYPGVVYGQAGNNSNPYFAVKNFVSGVQLSRITGSVNSVDFIPSTSPRLDLSRWETGIDEGPSDFVNNLSKSLFSININDIGSNCMKMFQFNYSYFEDNVTPSLNQFNGIQTDKKRLRLNSINELSCDGSIVIPPYRFNYFSETVPRRMSFGKDHWGFINGISTNTSLFPEVFDNRGSLSAQLNLAISNREPAWPAMRAGTIQSITYPTGGYSEFEFEPHSVYIDGQNKIIGGLRIKSISNTDPTTKIINRTDFEYKRIGTDVSSGILFSKPVYISLLRNDLLTKLFPNSNGCPLLGYDNQSMPREYILSDNTVRPMETTQGNHIGYEVVSLKKSNSGSSVYVYNVGTQTDKPDLINSRKLIVNQINSPGLCDKTIPVYPAPPLAFNPYRGELITESHFNQNGILLQEKVYTTLYQQTNSAVPGVLYFSLPYENNLPALETLYELRSAKKIESSVKETNYGPYMDKIEKITRTVFQSQFHNNPTRTIFYDSHGDSLIKKNTYAFDLGGSINSSISLCNYPAANFIDFYNYAFYNMGYASDLWSFSYGSTQYVQKLQQFLQYITSNRSSYSSCEVNRRSQIQQSFKGLKANADSKLKPILWLNDIYKNSLIESSEWKNQNLIKSLYIEYTNKRDDNFGVYPDNLKRIELSRPSSTFLDVSFTNNRTSLSIDPRYIEHTKINYLDGNQINILSRDGITVANQWGYRNQFPVVNIVNASNSTKDSSVISVRKIGTSICLGSSCSSSGSSTVSFFHFGGEKIVLSVGQTPPGARVTASFYLTGPDLVRTTYNLCSSTSPASSCQSVPSVIILPNMPKGNYNLEINASTSFGSYPFQFQAFYEFLGSTILRTGDKEFFYEGFEEQDFSGIVNYNSFTGLKSYNGSFMPSFTPPNNREYNIQWWQFENAKWNFKQQTYQPGIVLNGLIDEIRILPNTSQMTTYSYDYRYGLINICDLNNRKTSYVYDILGRLLYIKDHDGNIIKSFNYQYQTPQ